MYYHTLNEELRRRFGCKVYKLALDGGFTCPNRDGAIDTRGCIFCAGDGSGAFAADRALDIPQQIEAAKELKAAEVPIIHFYTMGRTDNIRKIARNVF